MTLIRYADRPDLLARRHAELSAVTFPAYMHENEPGNLYRVVSIRLPGLPGRARRG